MEWITNLENSINQFFYEVELYMGMAKIAAIFIISALVVLIILSFNIINRLNAMNVKIDKVLSMQVEKGYVEKSRDKNIQELIVLSKSNSKYHSEYAKKELERLQSEGGNTDGSDDKRSNEGDHGRG